jgi:hypothetical protein
MRMTQTLRRCIAQVLANVTKVLMSMVAVFLTTAILVLAVRGKL